MVYKTLIFYFKQSDVSGAVKTLVADIKNVVSAATDPITTASSKL